MATCIALLRGINVAGRRSLAMADLRALMTDLGHTDVVTYLQSGNVVFTGDGGSLAAVGTGIERAIERELGLDVGVVVRTPSRLERVIRDNPFSGKRFPATRVSVTFLDKIAPAAAVGAIDAGRFEPDRFRVVGKDIYLFTPNGLGRTKLTNTFFERALGVTATNRNWNTVNKLLELARR